MFKQKFMYGEITYVPNGLFDTDILIARSMVFGSVLAALFVAI